MSSVRQLVLASSLIAQPFAMAANIDSGAFSQQEVNIPVQIRPLADDFIDDYAMEEYLLEELHSPKVRIHYHYHFEEHQDNVEPEIDCEQVNEKGRKKKGKKIHDDDDYESDFEVDCGTMLLSPPENFLQEQEQEQETPSETPSEASSEAPSWSEAPSDAPSASSFVPSSTASIVPTGVPSQTVSPTMFPSMFLTSTFPPSMILTSTFPPSMILTSTAVPSQGYESESTEPSFQANSDAPSTTSFASHEPTSLETETNANVYSAKDTKKSIGSFWVAAIGICVLAFVGGFVSSRFLSKPKASSAANDYTDNSSIQLSVEDSVDSYCEDWSVSVVSWTPRVEVQRDEIEIEFGDHYQDEEDPRVLEEIDLNSQSSV